MFAVAQKRIEELKNYNDLLSSEQERQLRHRVQQRLALRLGLCASFLHTIQMEHADRIANHARRSPPNTIIKWKRPILTNGGDYYVEEEESKKLLHQIEHDGIHLIQEHEQEINRIIESMTQISDLLHRMQTIIIEQGSLLDHIDYNLDQSQLYLSKAQKRLEKSFRALSTMRKRKLILLFLILLIIILLIAIIARPVIPRNNNT